MEKNLLKGNESNKPYMNAYFWTQTINPKLNPYSPSDQLVKTYDDIKRILQGYNAEVYIELTDTYTLHYHNIVWCDNKNNHYLLVKRIQASIYKPMSVLGRMFKVNPFTSKAEFEERRNVYVKKDMNRTLEYITHLKDNCIYKMTPINLLVDEEPEKEQPVQKPKKGNLIMNDQPKRILALLDQFESIKSEFLLNWIDWGEHLVNKNKEFKEEMNIK